MTLRFEDRPAVAGGELPWLDRPDAQQAIERRHRDGELTSEQADWLRRWVRDGYVIFPGVLAPALAARINADVEDVLAAHRHLEHDRLRLEFQDLHVRSLADREALLLPGVLERLDLLLGCRVLPYQTLNLPVSSQQGAHSDQILMTTHPPGFMVAVWFALEDITPDSGPLVVYPGSHRLPYVSAQEVGIPRGAGEEECARVFDACYYERIRSEVQRRGLRPEPFVPRCGDILVWHSNLLHGAELVRRPDATRRSLIAHYFGEGAEAYSDLFQRPCHLPGLRPG